MCANLRRECSAQLSPGARAKQSGEGTVMTSMSSGR